MSTGYHPETQGLDERFNGTLIRILKMYVSENQTDWDLFLCRVLFAYRTSYHESIGDSPFYLVYGRDPKIPAEVKFLEGKVRLKRGNLNEYRRKLMYELLQSRMQVYSRLKQVQERIIASKENEQRKAISFMYGEPVWLFCYFRKSNDQDTRISKLSTKWHGPYRIVGQISENVYKLAVQNRSKRFINVNVNRLKNTKVSRINQMI